MIPVILFVLIGGCIGFSYAYDNNEPTGMLTFFGGIMGGILGAAIALLLGAFLSTPDDYTKYRSETEIISFQNNMTTQGSFFLGVGSFEGQKMYYYYADTPKGAINRKLRATETYVDETDSSASPKVVEVWYEMKLPVWHLPLPPRDVEGMEEAYTQIVVPEGSIKRNYNPN